MTAARRTRRPNEEERAAKRAAERRQMAEAIEALRSSEGWQRWLTVRRHFRTYSLLISDGRCRGRVHAPARRRWHVVEAVRRRRGLAGEER